ncbi:MAG: response regulator [Pirellulaceae bacterium]|nr:response regulator [Pirellulaceae bacterium]
MTEQSSRKQKVLLVEDSVINQKLLLYMLKNENYEVVLATNGQEAVDRYKECPFDFILMDVQMPVMDGIQATRIIRELELASGNHTPIIAVTAGMDRGSCMNAGMDDYIEKPVRVPVFHEVVARVSMCGQ